MGEAGQGAEWDEVGAGKPGQESGPEAGRGGGGGRHPKQDRDTKREDWLLWGGGDAEGLPVPRSTLTRMTEARPGVRADGGDRLAVCGAYGAAGGLGLLSTCSSNPPLESPFRL